MGGAILQKFLKNGVNRSDILVIDSNPQNKLADFNDIEEAKHSNYQADIVIFGIKPQDSEIILEKFANLKIFHKNTIFISILAGKNISFFTKILGEDKKIIRLMPNLPILIDEGICAYFSNKKVTQKEEKIVDLFGQNIKLKRENLINQVTAVSGSGPAYLFLFAKNFIEVSQKIGLNKDDSQKLVKQTIFGAAKMMLDEDDLEQLIKNVTSKGGTTAAALDVFNKPKKSLYNIILKSVKAAFKRSKELKL